MLIKSGIKPNIVDTLQREGIDLKSKGQSLWGKCPLHNDRNPSFKVDPKRQSFHCFGCGAHGDVISFIQRYHKLTFKEAMAHLGIKGDRPYRPDYREVQKRGLVKGFKRWCTKHTDLLAWELRGLRCLVSDIQTEEDLELRAWAFHEIPVLEYKLDVLCYCSDEAKYHLYKEATANE